MTSAAQDNNSNASSPKRRPARFIVAALLASLAWTAPSHAAAPEKDPIKEAIRKLYDISYVPIQSPIFTKIYAAAFYEVSSKLEGGDNMMASAKTIVARIQNNVFLLEATTTTRPMPMFLSTIKKDFRITKDEDAALFENTLDRLFPIGGFGDRDQKSKAFRRTKESVTFIRGEFFEKRKGFVLTLGPSGTITGITYSLDIKK